MAGEVTLCLQAARGGDAGAVDRLFELLYPELRRIARARMRDTDERVVLDTTSLLHECYLRMVKLERLEAQDRAHFLGYAGRAMRCVVVDIARERLAQRRGGDLFQVTLDTGVADAVSSGAEELVKVHDALEALGAIDPRLVQVVELRYFVGLNNPEVAEALGTSLRTVERDWERARAFLFDALRG